MIIIDSRIDIRISSIEIDESIEGSKEDNPSALKIPQNCSGCFVKKFLRPRSSHFVTCFQLAVLSPGKYDDGSTLYVCSRSISQQWLAVDKKEFGAAIRRNFPLSRNFANDYALDGNLLRESFVLPACAFQVCRLLNRSWCIVENTFRNTHVFVRINIRKRTIHIIYTKEQNVYIRNKES